jgi:2-polyprenyl-3-methyl-5-hydroxy-6-metoxy-1,4-benzoquinol methylase
MNRGNVDLECPACQGRGRETRLVVEEHYLLIRCPECRSEYLRPMQSVDRATDDAVISQYWEQYKFDIYANEQVQRDYEERYASLIDVATRAIGPIASVLDIGCGIGNFLAFAEARGMTAYGTDIEPDAVAVARSRGLTAEVSDRLDDMMPSASVDALTMWDVIEHLYDPESLVKQAVCKLRPGGVFLLETPDGAFWVRRVLRGLRAASFGRADLTSYMYYWEHKIYFSEDGLTRFLERMGLRVIHVERKTSPRAKMQDLFTRSASKGLAPKALAALWPKLEAASRRAQRGNKLLVVAVKNEDQVSPSGP